MPRILTGLSCDPQIMQSWWLREQRPNFLGCHSPLFQESANIRDRPWDHTHWNRGPQVLGLPRCSYMPQTPSPQTCSHRLHGSYEVMRGGHMNEAFVDFTGGVGEVLYLRQDTPGLFSALRHALAKESLVGATALVRESDSHGDPPPPPGPNAQSQPEGEASVSFSSPSPLAYSLSQIKHSQN